jgi:hypothetical protein
MNNEQKIKEITGDITPLPWRINENDNKYAKWIDIDNEVETPVISFDSYWCKNNHTLDRDFWQLENKFNPKYIVKACNLFPELVEALEELTDLHTNGKMAEMISENDKHVFSELEIKIQIAKILIKKAKQTI